MNAFLRKTLFILAFFYATESKGQNELGEWCTEFQAGYSLTTFDAALGHSFSVGLCHRIINGGGANDGPLSAIPLDGHFFSANFVGLLTGGRFHPGVKLGYELMLIFVAARMELTILDGYTMLTPSGGINLFGAGSLMLGYSIGLNDRLKSGVNVSVNLNIGKF